MQSEIHETQMRTTYFSSLLSWYREVGYSDPGGYMPGAGLHGGGAQSSGGPEHPARPENLQARPHPDRAAAQVQRGRDPPGLEGPRPCPRQWLRGRGEKTDGGGGGGRLSRGRQPVPG